MIAATFVETMAGVGVVAAAVVGVVALLEKVTGLLGRWVRRQVTEATDPLKALTRHHLGENGDTVPVHHRISAMEQKIARIEHCPHLRGEEVA